MFVCLHMYAYMLLSMQAWLEVGQRLALGGLSQSLFILVFESGLEWLTAEDPSVSTAQYFDVLR